MIVLVLDKDIIDDVGIYDDDAEDEIGRCLDWLFRKIKTAIRRKRMEMIEKKPGAVYDTDPRIMLVDMIRQPFEFPVSSTMHGAMTLRRKFNTMLNDAANHFGFNHMYIEACTREAQYDLMGNPNNEGKVDFWEEINNLIKKFDKKKLKLLPRREEDDRRRYSTKKRRQLIKSKRSY